MPASEGRRQKKALCRSARIAKRGPEPFRHQPLKDPANYIRLLEATPSMKDDSIPSFVMSTWLTDRAPYYNAISYTWGEVDATTIYINGRPMEVRTNCYKALLQAYRFESSALLWIDSVCINQSDLDEKSQQVAMMFDVYQTAEKVLACVGDADVDSQWLFEMCKSLDDIVFSSGLRPKDHIDAPKLAKRWAEQYSSTHAEQQACFIRVGRAFSEFGSRQYWHRAWIMQEIIAGDLSVIVLCGYDAVEFQLLGIMHDIAHDGFDGHDKTPFPDGFEIPLRHLSDILSGRWRRENLYELLDLTHSKDCQDPRDRVYSISALVDWKKYRIGPIFPDYSITPWQIAKKFVAGLDFREIVRLLEALEIDSSTPEMRTLVAKRMSPHPSAPQPCQTPDWRTIQSGDHLALRLSTNNQGALSCILGDAGKSESANSSLEETRMLLKSPEYAWCNSPERTPQKVFIGSQLIALVCSRASPGDLLVKNLHGWLGCLVLRPTENETFDVVGTGILGDPVYPPGKELDIENADEAFFTQMVLNATCEDIMAVCSADVCEAKTYAVDAHAELLYLMMIPLAAPEGAARLIPIDWTEKDGVWGPA